MLKAHNKYIVSNASRFRTLIQSNLFKLFIQDALGVLCIFIILYFGLIIGCAVESCGGY